MPDLQSELRKVTGMTKHSTQLKLIWEYVRDNPGVTNKKLQSHFKSVMPVIATSRATYDLLLRGMIYAEKRTVPRAPRQVNHYFIAIRMGGVYEEWPRPLKEKSVVPLRQALLQALAPSNPTTPLPLPEQTPAQPIGELLGKLLDADIDQLVDHLPVRYAKDLRSKLNELFKD